MAPSAAPAKLVAARLGVWGYRTTVLSLTAWSQRSAATTVYYRGGMRRAALALAGDLGLRTGSVIADASAPVALTLSLR